MNRVFIYMFVYSCVHTGAHTSQSCLMDEMQAPKTRWKTTKE